MSEGDTAQLNCIITVGQLPVQITWTFHGAADSAKVTQEGVTTMKLGAKSSVLMIDSVKASHAGNYSCKASNEAGNSEHTTSLVVNGRSIINSCPRVVALMLLIWPAWEFSLVLA
jgi:hypothetical protein